jgi:caffeoyl-CoA O-methyltransferase
MNTPEPMRRRSFLRSTGGAVGLAGLMAGGRGFKALAADAGGATASRTKEQLDKLIADLEIKGRKYYAIPRQDGQFLSLLVKATRAKNVLELGTVHGFAAIWIGLGLEESGGRLTTLEILPDRQEVAKKLVADAGLASRLTFKLGNAHELVPSLEGPFDFVFLNADKDGNVDYFQKLHPKKLASGALIVAANAVSRAEKMKDYLDLMTRNPDFDSVRVSATPDDAFLLSYRRRV